MSVDEYMIIRGDGGGDTMLSMDRPRPAKMESDRSMPRMSERRGGPLG